MIYAIPASSMHDLGLKARVLSWDQAEWWDGSEIDVQYGARDLVDDILNLAGMDRIRRSDSPFSYFLPGYAGPPQHVTQVVRQRPSNSVECETDLQRLGRKYQDFIDQFRVLDERKLSDSAAAIRLEKTRDCMHDAASYLRCKSVEDAMFQLVLVSQDVALAAGNDADDEVCSSSEDRAQRLLYSIGEYLEKLSGTSLDRFGGDYHMPKKYDVMGEGYRSGALNPDVGAVIEEAA